jgi:hypothetical protein
MNASCATIAGMFLLSSIGFAAAAPNIPPSELPGRERERFKESPVDRFMNAPRQTEPLVRWECGERASQRRGTKQRPRPKKRC